MCRIARNGPKAPSTRCLCTLLSAPPLPALSVFLQSDPAMSSIYFFEYLLDSCRFIQGPDTPLPRSTTSTHLSPQNFNKPAEDFSASISQQPHSLARKTIGFVKYDQLPHTSGHMFRWRRWQVLCSEWLSRTAAVRCKIQPDDTFVALS